ncbi:hypothetical protein P4E94_15275 [Pontiellaceae bacterium B12219]|nr:hypothetical protein [Pontiellaceae bacterium B12219]
MKKKYMVTVTAVLLLPLFSQGEEQTIEDHKPNLWHFFGSVVYSSRTLDGSIVDVTQGVNGGFGSMIATGESMNLEPSESPMLALGAQYKRFGFGLNYMPTSFEGQGYALVAGSGTTAGAMIKTPLNTSIDVNMLLANIYYNFIQTPDTIFGFGFGMGQTSIDLSIVPDSSLATPLIYNGTQPFGFLNLHFSSCYNRFLYGFALNGLSMDIDGVNIVYSDYKVDLGYRLIDKRMKLDFIGGYRLVNFSIDLKYDSTKVKTDVSLEGPFLGVRAVY